MSASPGAAAPGGDAGAVAWIVATWFGCGRSPRAPGTVGTLGALPLYAALVAAGGAVAVAAGALVVSLVGTWASARVVRERGDGDPQEIVVDEVAGVLVALVPAGTSWAAVAAGVLLFRLFDVTKPFPAGLAEARVGGGFGVMLDDLLAGAWAAVVLLVGLRAGLAG